MPETFGALIAECQLTAPAVPPLLIRQWAFSAFARMSADRRWGFQRRTWTLTPAAARSITATFSAGSATVTGPAATFLASDVGKQLLVGRERLWPIAAYVSDQQVTLAEPYQGSAGASAAAQVVDSYVSVPDGFQQFISVTDLVYRQPIPWWITQEQLDVWDPAREQVGPGRALVALTRSPYTGASLKPIYEWFPRQTAGGQYQVLYYKSPETGALTDETELPGALQDHRYALRDGVLAECAKFPGTPGKKNPYFNLSLADRLDRQFLAAVHAVGIVDDDQYPGQVIDDINWAWVQQGGVRSDHSLRSSDATTADYF